jgi:hypothetical protein
VSIKLPPVCLSPVRYQPPFRPSLTGQVGFGLFQFFRNRKKVFPVGVLTPGSTAFGTRGAGRLKALWRGWCLGSDQFKQQKLQEIDGKVGEHHFGELR